MLQLHFSLCRIFAIFPKKKGPDKTTKDVLKKKMTYIHQISNLFNKKIQI
jgi:hypothetical protein